MMHYPLALPAESVHRDGMDTKKLLPQHEERQNVRRAAQEYNLALRRVAQNMPGAAADRLRAGVKLQEAQGVLQSAVDAAGRTP